MKTGPIPFPRPSRGAPPGRFVVRDPSGPDRGEGILNTTSVAPQDVIRKMLAGSSELPVLPTVATRILEEMKNPALNARRMAEFVSKDPVLATAVLRVANSALYGGRTEITDLPFAMVRVGLQQVKNLVLALVLRSRMADPQVYGPVGNELMDHALAVAFASRLVADAAGIESDQAFLCGLLHDFGRLALIKALRESTGTKKGNLAPELMALVDEHHQEAGAVLATSWRLSELVAEVAAHHHHPERVTAHQPMVAVVAYANALAHRLGLGGGEDPSVNLVSHPSVALLGLSADTINDLYQHLPGLFSTARSAMSG